MPDLPISGLPEATGPLSGDELTVVVQDGVTRRLPVNEAFPTLDADGAIARAARPDIDRVNVKDYGAAGDGVTDDTAAILDAIEAACGGPVNGSGVTATRSAAYPLYFPAGDYVVSDVLEVVSVQNFEFAGDGARRTTFHVAGTGTREALLAINGSYQGYYHDFTVITKSGDTVSLTDVVKVDWDSTVAERSSQINTFERVTVRNCTWTNAGIAVGKYSPNVDVSDVTIRNVSVVGQWTVGNTTQWQYGIQCGNGTMGNVLNHKVTESRSVHNRYNVHVNNVNVSIDNVDLSDAEADVRHSGVQPFSVRDCRSENSDRLFLGDAGGTVGTMGVFENIIFTPTTLVADARFISLGSGGTYYLNNISVRGASGSGAKIYCNAGSNTPVSLYIKGCRIPTAIDSVIEAASPTTKPVTATFEGYAQVNTSGLGQNTQHTAFRHAGPLTSAITTVTTTYTIRAGDSTIRGDATSGAFTITAPTAAGVAGARYTVTKIDSSVNAVSITGTSSQTFSGESTLVLTAPGQSVAFQSNGTNWDVVTERTLSAPFPIMVSGRYYRTPNGGSTTNAPVNGLMVCTPKFIPHPITIDRIGSEVSTIGDVGSKVRLGIYADDGTYRPGALVLDAGQINGDSATRQDITVSQALGRGWYWFAAVNQSVVTTAPTWRVLSSAAEIIPMDATTSQPSSGSATLALTQSSVTGALPSTFTASPGRQGTGSYMWVRVA